MKIQKMLFCAIIILSANFANAYYAVYDLGTLGGNKSVAYSVNDSGQIVGQAWDEFGNAYACLFDPTGNGANINLGTLGGAGSIAYSINNFGQIVGQAVDYAGNSRACLFGSTNSDLGTLGGNNSIAKSISNNGSIVGAADTGSGISHACLFGQTNIDVARLGSSSGASIATSVNNSLQIAGYTEEEWARNACVFNTDGCVTQLNIESGAAAYAINNQGTIAGFDSYHSDMFACYWDTEGIAWEWSIFSTVYSVNEGNVMVGTKEGWEMGEYYYFAALFDPMHGTNYTNLNSLIQGGGGIHQESAAGLADTSEWLLTSAYDINNNGWIVGSAFHNGQERAFLLIIPEPATLLILVFGIGFIKFRK